MNTQLFEHYNRLWTSYMPEIGIEQQTTLELVAASLFCTSRNAKLTLKKMTDINWIIWKPGRGRGNGSLLTFLVQPDHLLLGLAKEQVYKGNIRGAEAVVREFEALFPFIADQFTLWLRSQFGFHLETTGQRQSELLRLGHDHPFERLDPAYATLWSELHMVRQVYDPLVRWDSDTDTFQPHLAHAWERGNDAREWTFYLRKGVLFHNGNGLTAADVKFTFERLCDPLVCSPYKWLVQDVEKIDLVDDSTVRIRLREPNELFLLFASSEHLSLVPLQHEVSALTTSLPGSGPFKIVKNDETMLVLDAFAPYFRERPILDRIEIWIVANWTAEMREDQQFQITYSAGGSGEKVAGAWRKPNKEMGPIQYLVFNHSKKGVVVNSDFRTAFELIIQRKEMIASLAGHRDMALDFSDEKMHDEHLQSSDSIKQLLRTSGYCGETLHLYTFPEEDHVEDAEWIKNQCTRYGVILETHYCAHEVLLQKDYMERADLILDSATITDKLDLSILDAFLSENSFLRNLLADELIDHIEMEISLMLKMQDSNQRNEILRRIIQRLTADKAILMLYRHLINIVADDNLRGITLNNLGWVDYSQLWFKK